MNGKFNERGDEYILNDKETKFPLHNYHFNKEYYTTIANDLSGDGMCFYPDKKIYTRGERFVLVKDGDEVWSAGGLGEGGVESNERTTEYNLYSTKVTAARDGLRILAEGFVPISGKKEYFIYRIKNLSEKIKKISVIVAYTIEGGPMSSECTVEENGRLISSETVPYHIYYDDYAKIEKEYNSCYSATSLTPSKVICNENVLFDGKRRYIENAFKAEERTASYNGEHIAAFRYEFDLNAGEEVSFSTVTGICVEKSDAKILTKKFLSGEEKAEEELEKVKEFFNRYTTDKKTCSGDKNIDNFASFWEIKQVLCMVQTKRFSQTYSIRNSLQDAMGLGFIDKTAAKEYFIKCIKTQKKNGSILQHGVWDDLFAPRGLGLLYMKDGPSWLVICVANYVHDCGDYEFLNTVVTYKDGGEDTVLKHLLNAVEFMWKDRGMYGLSLLGDGDWTDPINGPGRKGKGVSTWTSMAFVYGMRTLEKILTHIGQTDKANAIKQQIREMSENIISACFIGDRFIAGYNDDGVSYGCKDDEEGSLFLNMQSWAIISGVATGEYLKNCVQRIDELTTPLGALVMKPSFTKWNGKFGKISVKQAGKDENGSVYCHASAFAAYALFMVGEREKAENILKNILPTHEYKAEFDFQPPIFIPNYWFTKEPQYGYSSANVSTGTSAWFLKIYRDFYEKH